MAIEMSKIRQDNADLVGESEKLNSLKEENAKLNEQGSNFN